MSAALAAGLAAILFGGIGLFVGPHVRDYWRACRTPEHGEDR